MSAGQQGPGDNSTVPRWLPREAGMTFDSVLGPRTESTASPVDTAAETMGLGVVEPDQPGDQAFPQNVPYVPVRRIGRGGFGEVWEAIQTSLNRKVALKHLHAREGERGRLQERLFRHEAFTAAALDHPNIVPVYDFGADEAGRPVMSMKLVRGESWEKLLRKDMGELSAAEVLERHLPHLAEVTQAVVFAHDAGVIHRDLKPAQVMIGSYGEVLLMDWGLAILVDPAADDPPITAAERDLMAPSAARASSPAGTPAYMAPEQTLADATRIGTWTDVYLLGGILYYILTGRRPHEAESAVAAYRLASDGRIDPPGQVAPDRLLPEDLVDLAMSALRPVPEERIGSAREFLVALQSYLSGASRRRESQAISAAAIARAESLPGDYGVLASLINDLDRARMLWAGNEQARQGRERLLRAQTTLALREGDLLLARVTTERLSDAAERERLHTEVARAEQGRRARERERLIFRLATATLAVVVLGGGAWFVRSLTLERRAAEEARDRALAARSSAEDLLNFMIGDLRSRLEPVGRLDVLSAVGDKAQAYLDGLGAGGEDAAARLMRVRTATQLVALRSARGEQDAASALADSVEPLVQAGLSAAPGDRGWLAAKGDLRVAMGDVAMLKSEIDRGRALYREAMVVFEELMKAEPTSDRWVLGFARASRGIGDGYVVRAENAEGREIYAEALRLLEEARARRPEVATVNREVASMHYRLAFSEKNGGDLANALTSTGRSIQIYEDILGKDPRDATSRNELIDVMCLRALVLDAQRETTASIEWQTRAVDLSRAMYATDTANAEWASDVALQVGTLGDMQARAGRRDEGVALMEEAISLGVRLIGDDPQNMHLLRDLLVTGSKLASVYSSEGRFEDVVRVLKASVEPSVKLAEREPKVVALRSSLDAAAKSLADASMMMLVRGQVAESLDGQRARLAVYESLLKMNPGERKQLSNIQEALLALIPSALELRRWDEVRGYIKRHEQVVTELIRTEATPGSEAASLYAVAAFEGMLAMRLGDRTAAEQHFREAVRVADEDLGALKEIDRLQLRGGAARVMSSVALLRVYAGDAPGARTAIDGARRMIDASREALLQGTPELRKLELLSTLSVELAEARVMALEGRDKESRAAIEAILLRTTPIVTSPSEVRVLQIHVSALLLLGRTDEAAPGLRRLEAARLLTPEIEDLAKRKGAVWRDGPAAGAN